MLQSAVLFALFLTIRKTTRSVQNEVNELRGIIVPIVDDSRAFLNNVAPRIQAAAVDLAEMTDALRAQSRELEKTSAELFDRVRKQVSHVDAILSKILDGVDQAGTIVANTVNRPVRQLQGIVASAKAVFGVLRSGAPAQAETHLAADQDLFV